jgi:phosphatidate cytidylyltransferase
MLKQRVITAVCLVAVFLLSLLCLPSIWFFFLMAICLLIAAWEWANLAGLSRLYEKVTYCLISAVLAIALGKYLGLLSSASLNIDRILPVFIGAGVWWAIALLWVQGYPSSAVLWGYSWVRSLMGFLVLVPSALALMFLYKQPHGVWLILMIVAIVTAADIGAYFFGRMFGQRKLARFVSPGKSWEGVLGGLLVSAVLALVIAWNTDSGMWWMMLVIVLPTALVSVLGDLLESMVKRHCGVKDSGHLLPGHGGLLDRIDGFTAALPVFVLAIILSGWPLSV